MEKPLPTRTRHETYAELVQLAFPKPSDIRKIDDSWCEKPLSGAITNKTASSTNVKSFKETEDTPAIRSSTGELINDIWSKSRKIANNRLNVLHISAIILMILLVVEAIIIIVLSTKNPQVCLAPDCIETAYQISYKLDTSTEPCTDFYHFACGNYIKETILEEHEQRKNIFTEVASAMATNLKLLLNEPFTGHVSKHQQILKQVYNLCQENVTDSVDILLPKMNELANWPIIEGSKWNNKNFNWTQLMIKLKKNGFPYEHFIQIDVQPNMYNTSKNILIINCCTTPIIKVDKYLNETLTFFKLNSPTSNEDLHHFVTFRNNIMKINEEAHNDAPSASSIAKLQSVFGGLDWRNYLTAIVGHSLTNDDELIVISPLRVNKMLSLLNSIQPSMSLPLYQLYAKKYFNNKTKNEIGNLLSNIRNELLKSISLSEWLDESTRKEAIGKAEAISSYVGYPDALLDDHFLEAYYSKLFVDPQSYLNSMLLLNSFNENQKFSRLHQPSNKVMMVKQSNTMDSNIRYDLIYNTLGIMVATLPKLLFDIEAPKSLNYGGVGMLIASQMIHGFDNEGRKYDKNGNLKDWWTNSTFANYEQKSQCFIKQFEKYNLANLQTKIDGKLTLRENIADNAGVKIAYLAYKAVSKDLGPEKKFPGINYTRNQMFWISFAQLWCTKSQRSYVQPSEYLPEKYRVIGALSNLKEFSEDFKCPVNSTMNPSEKCLLW